MQVASSRPSPYQVAFVVVEALLMAAATLLAVYLRTGEAGELFTWRYSWHRIILVPLVLQVTFYYSDLHNFRIARPFTWTVARVAQALALGSLALAVIYYLMPRLFLGRGVLVLGYFTIFSVVILWRGVYAWALRQRLFATRLMVMGSGRLADDILEELVSRADNLYQVVCLVDTSGEGTEEEDPDNLMPYWARIMRAELRTDTGELTGLARYLEADMLLVAMDEKRGRMPVEELLRLRMMGIPIISGEDFFERIAGRILADRISASWLIFSEGFSNSGLRRLSKRAMDLTLSALGLVLLAPFALLTAIAVRLESKGPALYRQERVGQHGRTFEILKFRSMVTDAESGTGPVWASHNDPRVTRVGRVIRKTRLDEIPQLWNVLKGQMSFVGPRPERPHFVEELAKVLPYYHERHNVKPGITGWAQVCYPYGSSVGAALEKLNYDLYYIKHSSLSMDVMIIVQTVKIILFGGGGR